MNAPTTSKKPADQFPEFGALLARLPREGGEQERVSWLVREIAALVRATSNDQNVQRLAQTLIAAAPNLAATLFPTSAMPKAGD